MTGKNKPMSSISLASAIGMSEAGAKGHLLSDLDACRAAAESSRARARLQSKALNKILIGLGTVLNIPDPSGQKAIWLPETRVGFLGLLIDSSPGVLLAAWRQAAGHHALGWDHHATASSFQQAAQMAGKMIAAAPAIQLSKLYAGAMYKVMTRELEWDTMYPSCKQTWSASETP